MNSFYKFVLLAMLTIVVFSNQAMAQRIMVPRTPYSGNVDRQGITEAMQNGGVRVTKVYPNTTATKLKDTNGNKFALEPGDIICVFNNQPIRTVAELKRIVESLPQNSPVRVTVKTSRGQINGQSVHSKEEFERKVADLKRRGISFQASWSENTTLTGTLDASPHNRFGVVITDQEQGQTQPNAGEPVWSDWQPASRANRQTQAFIREYLSSMCPGHVDRRATAEINRWITNEIRSGQVKFRFDSDGWYQISADAFGFGGEVIAEFRVNSKGKIIENYR
jgi:hypothetical protein